jgi:hypothetical protein
VSLLGQLPENIGSGCMYRRMMFALLSATVMSSAAACHEWYPHECCGKTDCAPVERIESMPDGFLRLTSRVGATVVSPSFPRQRSPDGRIYICMVRYSHLDDMRPVCLFVPDAPETPS